MGDEVVLLGRQGDERIDAEEMATWLDTISYEVLCSPSRLRAARLHQRMNKGELRARMRQARRALSEAAQQEAAQAAARCGFCRLKLYDRRGS